MKHTRPVDNRKSYAGPGVPYALRALGTPVSEAWIRGDAERTKMARTLFSRIDTAEYYDLVQRSKARRDRA